MPLKERELIFNKKLLELLKKLDLREAIKEFIQFRETIPLTAPAPFILATEQQLERKFSFDILHELAKRAVWLNADQQRLVAKHVWKFHESGKIKDIKKTIKFLAVILAIPYAEQMQDKNGILNDFIYEHFIKFKEFVLQKEGEPSSYSSWQVPFAQLERLFKKEFSIDEKKHAIFKSLNDPKAVELVARIILENIGLDKDIRQIFAGYNHRKPYCTEVATLQIFLNLLKLFAKKLVVADFKEISITENDIAKVLRSHEFKMAVKQKDQKRLIIAANSLKHDETKKREELISILDDWVDCDIDGAPGSQVKIGLACAKKFFKLDIKLEIEEIKDVDDVWAELKRIRILDHFNIHDVHSLPTHTPLDGKKLEALLKKIMKHKNLEKGIIETLKNDERYAKRLEKADDDYIIYFFRRNLFSNPYNVHNYSRWAIRAFKIITAGISL